MAWGTFLGVVIGVYAFYYVLNLLYDLFFSRKQKASAGGSIHYNMRDLIGEEEGPEEVQDEYDEEADDYLEEEEEDFEQEPEEAFEEAAISANPAESMKAAAPPLRVKGQGIPLDEFLKEAKNYSSSIF